MGPACRLPPPRRRGNCVRASRTGRQVLLSWRRCHLAQGEPELTVMQKGSKEPPPAIGAIMLVHRCRRCRPPSAGGAVRNQAVLKVSGRRLVNTHRHQRTATIAKSIPKPPARFASSASINSRTTSWCAPAAGHSVALVLSSTSDAEARPTMQHDRRPRKASSSRGGQICRSDAPRHGDPGTLAGGGEYAINSRSHGDGRGTAPASATEFHAFRCLSTRGLMLIQRRA